MCGGESIVFVLMGGRGCLFVGVGGAGEGLDCLCMEWLVYVYVLRVFAGVFVSSCFFLRGSAYYSRLVRLRRK